MIKQPEPGNSISGFFKNPGFFLSKGPVAISLFTALVLTLACVNLLDFPLSVPYMKRISGNSYLDMHMLYSADKVYYLLESIGKEGRKLQLLLLPTIDILIPALSGLAGFSMIAYLFKKPQGQIVSLVKLRHFAIAASLTDYLENTGIFIMTFLYPERFNLIAFLTGILTALKFLLYSMTLLIILGGIACRLNPFNQSGTEEII